MLKRLIIIVGGIFVLVGLLSLLPGRANILDDPNARQSLVYLSLLLIYFLISPNLLKNLSGRTTLRYAFIWLGIILALLVGYSYKDTFIQIKDRLALVLLPDRVVEKDDGQGDIIVTTQMSGDGHFYVIADVEGVSIRFLVDSGASSVALSQADAESLGIRPSRREFNLPTSTANGMAMAAPVTLRSITIGRIQVDDVRGAVLQGENSVSLLGMSFLNKLKSWRIEGNTLEMVGQ